MRQIIIQVDVEEVYINNKGDICADIIIKQKNNQRSRVINISQVFKEEPPK